MIADWLRPNRVDEGPEYPRDLGKDVSNFRRDAKPGLAGLSRMARRGYGNAVLAAFLRMQRTALRREKPGRDVHCASGTNYNTGEAILEAVRKQNRSAMFANLAFDQVVANEKYAEAMKAKRAAMARPIEMKRAA